MKIFCLCYHFFIDEIVKYFFAFLTAYSKMSSEKRSQETGMAAINASMTATIMY